MPDGLNKYIPEIGEFVVKFFGSGDHAWTSIGRCFAFSENDTCSELVISKNTSKLELAFSKGVEKARLALKQIAELKQQQQEQQQRQGAGKESNKKPIYTHIEKNVHFNKSTRISEETKQEYILECKCNPKDEEPCSHDTCHNRAVKYECDSELCAAKERCNNQVRSLV
jgi:hypothetical protein